MELYDKLKQVNENLTSKISKYQSDLENINNKLNLNLKQSTANNDQHPPNQLLQSKNTNNSNIF